MAFSHPYYFLLGAGFLGSYAFIHWLQYKKSEKSLRTIYLYSLGAAILPGIFIKSWEYFTSIGATDFVKYPFGFIQYRAGFESIFLPMQDPYVKIWDSIIKIKKYGIEGQAYVGFVGLLVLAFSVGRIVSHLRQKKKSLILRPVLPNTLKTSIWAATLILIPAFVYPFQLMPESLDLIPFVRQFRSMGRLSWIFFYVFMVYCSVLIYQLSRLLRQNHKKKLAVIMVLLASLSWLSDAVILGYHERSVFLKNETDDFYERQLDFKHELQKAGYKVSDFQAMIALPFFHIGSEKLQYGRWEASRLGMEVSRQTGLSMLNFMAARSPLSQSMEAVQLASSPLIIKRLPKKLPNNKPILLVYYREEFSLSESRLIARSKRIATIGKFGFASLELSAFKDDVTISIDQFREKKENLFPFSSTIFSDKPIQGVVMESFGDHPSILGQKISRGKHEVFTIFDGTVNTRWENMIMELSFWVKLELETNYLPRLDLKILRDGKVIDEQQVHMLETKDVYQDWARVRAEFKLGKNTDRILAQSKIEKLTIDNVMIRPVGINIYSWQENGGCILMNNYFLCEEKEKEKI